MRQVAHPCAVRASTGVSEKAVLRRAHGKSTRGMLLIGRAMPTCVSQRRASWSD
jgi:hypothetical protein